MVKPLEESVRPWSSRRGGGSVDEAGGRLRRPDQAVRNAEAWQYPTGARRGREALPCVARCRACGWPTRATQASPRHTAPLPPLREWRGLSKKTYP